MITREFAVWIDARKKFKLSHVQMQMAKELGLNPKKFGSMSANLHQKWKAPLGEFIEDIYLKRFKREKPERVLSLEELRQEKIKKKDGTPTEAVVVFENEPLSALSASLSIKTIRK